MIFINNDLTFWWHITCKTIGRLCLYVKVKTIVFDAKTVLWLLLYFLKISRAITFFKRNAVNTRKKIWDTYRKRRCLGRRLLV